MPIFRTLSEITDNPWTSGTESTSLPLQEEWLSSVPATLENIDTWEQVYSQPGNISVYAAWSPYVELYIIVYPVFLESNYGIEIYTSSEKTSERLSEFNIHLPVNTIWI
jgi:hypothetical protein